jgi:hypothetical protein|tara:strand:- start:4301 stop:4483 length:183 start_codon:yes stop_codon:yes gene_type:complete
MKDTVARMSDLEVRVLLNSLTQYQEGLETSRANESERVIAQSIMTEIMDALDTADRDVGY